MKIFQKMNKINKMMKKKIKQGIVLIIQVKLMLIYQMKVIKIYEKQVHKFLSQIKVQIKIQKENLLIVYIKEH